MGKSTVQDVIDNAVAAYRGIESIGGRGAEIVEAVWDALTGGMKSAVGRRIAACMGAEWCGAFKRDAFNRYLAFVELCVTGEKVGFLEPTPAAELQAQMERMALAPISGGSPEAEFIVEGDKLPKVEGPDAVLGMIREGLATLRRAYDAYPSDVTAKLIHEYEAAVRELERRRTTPAPAAPKVPARGGQHAPPATDAGDPVVGICGFSYRISPLPIHSSIGSHAYQLHDLDRNRVHHVCRDLFGQPDCTCADHTFRREGSQTPCKHAAKLMEMGLMPLTPRVLPPLAMRA